MNVHVATAEEAGSVTRTISHAFHDDPTWSWAFPDAHRRQARYEIWWRLLVDGAMRYPWVLATPGCEVAAVWLPPDGTELTPEDEVRAPSVIAELVGGHAPAFMDLLERFDAARPVDPRFDELGVPTYLESSNCANNPKYERLGYDRLGEFTTPDDAVVITRYWREAR